MSKSKNPVFRSVLIANRGEIACRIIRSARYLGIKTLAIYSSIDSNAKHVKLADEAVYVGDAPALKSYLNINMILDIAQSHHVDCIHPGYGFLSESSDFAKACQQAAITLIGPSPEALQIWGDKYKAKSSAMEQGVATLPGCILDDREPSQRKQQVQALGLPCLFKPTQGGGGIGMQVMQQYCDLEKCYEHAMGTTCTSKVLAERFLEKPRHIEVQVAVDCTGHAIHLFERECSIQRRYQKLIEEAPADCLNESQKQICHDMALRVITAHPYLGLATIEFLFDGQSFYFIEVNPRLQVEHTVTEMITGLDLVTLQFQLAAHKHLHELLPNIQLNGCAIQVRICAEDPITNFTPSHGRIQQVDFPPQTSSVRVDSGISNGDKVSLHYDSLLAKLIVHATSRHQAVRTLQTALQHCEIDGINHNIIFLSRLVTHQDWCHNRIDRDFIDTHHKSLIPIWQPALWHMLAFAAAYRLHHLLAKSRLPCDLMGWQLYTQPSLTFTLWYKQKPQFILLIPKSNHWEINFDGQTADLQLITINESHITLSLHEKTHVIMVKAQRCGVLVTYLAQNYSVSWQPTIAPKTPSLHPDLDHIKSPMPGIVTALHIKVGQLVSAETILVTLEAMKLEHQLRTNNTKRVIKIHCQVGDQVAKDTVLVSLETSLSKEPSSSQADQSAMDE